MRTLFLAAAVLLAAAPVVRADPGDVTFTACYDDTEEWGCPPVTWNGVRVQCSIQLPAVPPEILDGGGTWSLTIYWYSDDEYDPFSASATYGPNRYYTAQTVTVNHLFVAGYDEYEETWTPPGTYAVNYYLTINGQSYSSPLGLSPVKIGGEPVSVVFPACP